MRAYFKKRIKKPADIVKQPWLDFQRLLAKFIFKAVKSKVKKNMRPESIEKILLVRRNKLGDAVNTLPSIQALKNQCPDIKIHVLANKYNSIIYDRSPIIDKVHVIDEKWFLRKLTFFANPVFKDIKKEKFDIVIGMGGYSSALSQLVLWSKGRYAVGPVSNKDTFYNLVFDKGVLKTSKHKQHHTDDMADIIREAGFAIPKELPFPTIVGNGKAEEGVIAICPDVNRKQSEYSIDNFKKLVQLLHGLDFIKKIHLFLESEGSKYIQLEGEGITWIKTKSVEAFVDEVSKCQYVISTEGGSAHIASALGLGLVTISGMNHKNYWRPFGEKAAIIEKHRRINDITAEEIVEQLCLISK